MTDDACPACGDPIEEIDRLDPTTFVLRPCGHQVDDRAREQLTTSSGNNH